MMKNIGEELVLPLLEWYDSHARILPWREQPSPYRVWISEIMLQQTRVEAVKPYYERFMERLPDVRSLSQVEEDVLLKLWEGLGYYNRARNLKKAALVMMEKHGGELPASYEQLLALPGIGSYTAGAIASIAFGLPYPAVDGNVLRVIARAVCYEKDILSAAAKSEIAGWLSKIMPAGHAGAFNQALMELGAMVCVPNGLPRCAQCPWEQFCMAHASQKETDYPVKGHKKARTIEEYTILILQDAERTAIRKRPNEGLLAGMYEFPWVKGIHSREEVIQIVKEMGYAPLHIRELKRAKHIFTHKEWHMAAYAVRVDELMKRHNPDLLFAEGTETEEKYPMPAAFCAYTEYLHIRLGNARFKKRGGSGL